MKDVTAIVATYKREKSLDRMINSFRKYYPELQFIIADNGPEPTVRNDVLHIVCPTDCGISKARNIALERVTTPYVLVMDDDYVCTHETNLEALMSKIVKEEFDIAGGNIVHEGVNDFDFHGRYEIANGNLYHFVGATVPEAKNRYDVIFNFFVARTTELKEIRWDEKLPFAKEHDDFFLRTRDRKITYLDDVKVRHPFEQKHYGGRRGDESVKWFLKKWGLKTKYEIRKLTEGQMDYFDAVSGRETEPDQYILSRMDGIFC